MAATAITLGIRFVFIAAIYLATMVLLFLVLVFVVFDALMGIHREVAEHAISFAILIATIAAIDVLASVLLERWISRRTENAR